MTACSTLMFVLQVGLNLKLIDSGSMSCSISEAAAAHLLQHCTDLNSSPADDVVVGVGGQHVYPKAVYDLEVV